MAGKTVTALSTSGSHTLAVTSDGMVYAWGSNSRGELGDGTLTTRLSPVAVDRSGVLSGKTIVAVSAGFEFSLALSSDGLVFAWGGNTYGNLGDGTGFQRKTPVAVDTTGVLATKVVIAIDAGADFSAALTSDGLVFTWGHNTNGQLGQGNYTNSNVPGAVVTSGILLGKTVTAISMGTVHGHAVTSTGIVVGWGYNVNGTLADGSAAIRESSPVAIGSTGVMSAKTMVAVSAGDDFTLALASDGTVFGWGQNGLSQLGDGSATIVARSPVETDMSGALSGKSVTAISAGSTHSLALTSDGELYAWGGNHEGSIGDGTTTERTTPVAVNMSGALAGMSANAVSAGVDVSAVLASPSFSTITPAYRFTYAANFGWLNWRTNPLAADAPVIETTMAHGKVYAANVGWIDLGDGKPSLSTGYTQTGGDIGVNHDGAGALSGYAYGANIGWISFDPTIGAPPRVDLVTGALSGYAYSANCGWIDLGTLKTVIHPGADADSVAGGSSGAGDGIPDAWELELAVSAGLGSNLALLGSTPNSDFDHDGVSDADEYIADTNPFSATERLKVTRFTYNPATGDVDLDWTGTDRRVYSVYCSSNLSDWQPVGSPLTGGTAGFTLGAPAAPHLFFRVQAGLPLPAP